MSNSTNAYFFFGICWDEDDHFWPWHPEFGTLPEAERAGEDETDTAWLKRQAPSLADALTIGEHCTPAVPMGYVAVTETHELAWRGYPKRLPLPSLYTEEAEAEQEAQWRALLRAFCEVAGYDFDHLDATEKIGWWLCSWAEDVS